MSLQTQSPSIGQKWVAKVNQKTTTVEITDIQTRTVYGLGGKRRSRTVYYATNLTTRREVVFKSRRKLLRLAS